MERRLAAVLAADVVGYSRLMGDDETGTLAELQRHRVVLFEPKAKQHNGRTVKLMGDGTLMEFASVVDAVTFAVDLQIAMAKYGADLPEDCRIVYRIGINLGDIVHQDDDIYGDGVNVAARLEGLAKPGGICISRSARDQVRDKLDLTLEDLGEVEVKNIARPVRAFHIVMDEKAAVLNTPVVHSNAPPKAVPRSGIAILVAVVALATAGALLWWRPWAPIIEPATNAQATLVALDKNSIAVLPFQNMSNDKEQDYFADGIAEDVITDLSKISGLFVIARNTSFQFRGGSHDLQKVGRKLGVRYILEGSVRRASDQVRINAQLIDAATGGHVWAERYDGKLADVFSVQDKVTARIIDALRLQLTSTERQAVASRETEMPIAYDAYLRGISLLSKRRQLEVGANLAAQAEFNKAIQIDPDYALAIAGLAWAKWLEINSINNFQSTDQVFALAERSLALKENALAYRVLATRHFFLQSGWVWTTGKPELAVAELEKAHRLEPNNPDVLADLATALCFAGDPSRALTLIKKAMQLNPNHPKWYFAASGIARLLIDEPARAVQDLRAWSNDFRTWRTPYLFLAAALGSSGEIEAAKAAVARYNNLYAVGTNTSLYAVRRAWPMAPQQQEIFQKGLQLAGMKETPG